MTAKNVTIEDLTAIVAQRGAAGRSITALAGAPGVGKSTQAEALVDRLNTLEPDSAAVFPMDGFHYDDLILNARGWRPRKGAPHTFDVAGFGHMLRRLRANTDPEVAVPVFDRSIETARNSARLIPQSVRHLVVEGNYLLLDRDPWRGLLAEFDTTVFLNVPMPVLRARLEQRWKTLAPDDFAQKMNENDLPNAELVVAASGPAEFVLCNG